MENNQKPQLTSFLESFVPNIDDRERVLREAAYLTTVMSALNPMNLGEGIRFIMHQNVLDETKLYLVHVLSINAGIDHVNKKINGEMRLTEIIPYVERDTINPIINAN